MATYLAAVGASWWLFTGVLGVLPLVVLAQLGVVICVGVLLDTSVVRTVLVPAIAVKLGNPFWWPRRLGNAMKSQ